MLHRVVGKVFSEVTRGVSQNQPEEQYGKHNIEQQRYFDTRIQQICAQKRIHTRKFTLLQPLVAQDMPRGAGKKPYAEDTEQNKTDRSRANQNCQIAVVEIYHIGRQIAVMVGKFYPVGKHLLAVSVDVSLSYAKDRVLEKHLHTLLPKRKSTRIDIGVFVPEGYGRGSLVLGVDACGRRN